MNSAARALLDQSVRWSGYPPLCGPVVPLWQTVPLNIKLCRPGRLQPWWQPFEAGNSGGEEAARNTGYYYMPTKLLGALAIIVVFSILMGRKNRKQRDAVWAGVVTQVKHQRPSITNDEDRRGEDWVWVFYRTDEGADGKLKLRMASLRQYLQGVQVGDRLVKRRGDYLPRKASPELAEDRAAESDTTRPA